MHSYGPRQDPDGVVTHARVSQAHRYDVVTTLYRRRVAGVAGAVIICELLRAKQPARRLIRLRATYTDAGVQVDRSAIVRDPVDEARTLERWEREIRAAAGRPEPPAIAPK